MSAADDVLPRYTEELRGFGPSLPDDLASGASALEGRLTPEELDQWAAAGVALARHSLRSWEAAAEYFRVSPRLIPAFSFAELIDWSEVARELAESSSMIAAAFVRATPEVLQPLQGADTGDLGIMGEWIGRPGEQVRPWALLGKRLAHGNWKSVALAASFFEQSPALLHALPLDAVGELVDVVDRLSERSYQLAASCLERSGELFGTLAPPDRRPFLEFAAAVAHASWADTRLYFERGPALIANIDRDERGAFLKLAADVTGQVGRQGYPLFIEAAESLAQVEPTYHETLVELAHRLAGGSPAAAMAFLRSSPIVLTRLTADQLERWLQGGWDLLFEQHNLEGAEAYFRLESARAEEMLESLSARVEPPASAGSRSPSPPPRAARSTSRRTSAPSRHSPRTSRATRSTPPTRAAAWSSARSASTSACRARTSPPRCSNASARAPSPSHHPTGLKSSTPKPRPRPRPKQPPCARLAMRTWPQPDPRPAPSRSPTQRGRPSCAAWPPIRTAPQWSAWPRRWSATSTSSPTAR
jgi:hypothetical protein